MGPDQRQTEGAPSPARLYAALVGAALAVLGILGFFYSASFGSPGEVDEALGLFAVNGWANLLYIAVGALGLLLAGFAARTYALWTGIAFLAIAVWGFALGSGEALLGVVPVNTAADVLHLALGLFGVWAALATKTSVSASSAARPGEARKRSRPARANSQAINS